MARALALALSLAVILALGSGLALAAKPLPAASPSPAAAAPATAPPSTPELVFSPCTSDPTFAIKDEKYPSPKDDKTPSPPPPPPPKNDDEKSPPPAANDKSPSPPPPKGVDDDKPPSPSPSPPGPKEDKDDKDEKEDKEGGCSDDDPANAKACAPSSVAFSCGSPPEIEKLICPAGSIPCRLVPGVSTCDGDVVSMKEDADGALRIEARGILAPKAPVLVAGAGGYCTFPDAGSPLRPPANCGGGDKTGKCALVAASVCFCSGKNGALRFVSPEKSNEAVASLSDRAALPCEAIALESMAALDSCGVAVPVVVTITTAPEEGGGGQGGGQGGGVVLAPLAPGSTIGAGKLSCGKFIVSFTATHPSNPELSASTSYALTLGDKVVPQAPGASLCQKTWQTACSGAAVALVPEVGISGCTIAAKFAAQKDVCGVVYPIANEIINVGSCGANKR